MLTRNPKTKSSLQILQDSVKWHHMAHKVSSLLDVYSGLLSNESMILAVNSSFVDPLLQFESQLKIIESSFGMLVVMPSLDKVKEMGSSYEYIEDMKNLYHNILNTYENILTSLVSKDLYKLQILKEMLVWMRKDSSYMQERIMVIINKVLRFTVTKVRKYISVDAPCLGLLAAELSLLCSHEDPSIVKQASLGMCHLLYIARCQNDIGTNKPTNGKSHSLQFPSSDVEFLPKEFQQDESKIAQVSKIVDAIYRQLCDNNCMKDVMLQVITLLTCTSPKKVIFQLMDYPVPADDTLIQMWQAAGSQVSVAPHVLKTILLILKGKPGEMEDTVTEGKRFSLDTTNLMPLAACQALCTFLPLGSYRKAVAQYFPQLLTTLMFQVFYNSELKPILKDRALYAQDALRVLLNCSGLRQVDITLMKENFWDQLSEDLCYYHGVCFIAKTLSEYNFPQFPETLSYLYKVSVEGPRRSEDTVIVLLFLTELLNNYFKDPLPEEFLVLFINWIKDSNPVVSRLILHRIVHMLPIINKINGGIRSMAIRHFGQLVRDMRQYTWMVNDVVLEGLVPLILFLEDDDKRVAEACKYTLKICTSQLKWSTSRLLKDENYSFEMVVLNICNNLITSHRNYITDLTSDTLRFLWSPRTYLKRASVILIGYLAKSGGHLLLRDEIRVMLDVIGRLLRDEDPMIKQLAEITYDIFKKKAHKLTSAPLKQNFQKLLKLFYIKKLKPLYNYNSPNGQIDSPTDSKDIKNDKAL
ncbi:maestro heat-like repeat-containing protein family member 9 isoform X3 [Pan troglodytes]|uniref:maestro heat-like repeat-containing protein family member 9 isoform X3 n=1 Tax=Pan troglodytes TaxID=9598 RepID=UPI0023F2C8D5|nr:maestro heat-like repeat-containing protein family member 9 isoform X3 [Pan troglodytes]